MATPKQISIVREVEKIKKAKGCTVKEACDEMDIYPATYYQARKAVRLDEDLEIQTSNEDYNSQSSLPVNVEQDHECNCPLVALIGPPDLISKTCREILFGD
jgi:hypothetical protein